MGGSMDEANEAKSRALYYFLCSSVRGEALACVRSVASGEGLAAWRSLVLGYEPRTHKRWNAMLMGLLSPGWDKKAVGASWKVLLLDWERRIREYEGGSGRHLGEELRVATVCRHAPDAFTDCLRLGAPVFRDDYRAMIGCIAEYEASGQAFNVQGDIAVPMDVGGIGGQKKLTGNCFFFCDKLGHRQDECRSYLRSVGKGKGDGEKKGGKKGGKGKGKGKGDTPLQKGNNDKTCGWCGKQGHTENSCW